MGRCARHVEGRAILYADVRTRSMNEAIAETNRRREKQVAYNQENGITPQSIIKSVDMELAKIVEADYVSIPLDAGELDAAVATARTEAEVAELLGKLETQMREAATTPGVLRVTPIRAAISPADKTSPATQFRPAVTSPPSTAVTCRRKSPLQSAG